MSKPKRTNELHWRDSEDLALFARELRDIAARGQSFEPMGSPTYETPSFPGYLDSFSTKSRSAMARLIHERLVTAATYYAPAAVVLLALHDPASLMCDGKSSLSEEEADRCRRDPSFRVREQLDVGRRLGVYPCTWSADEARRWKHSKLERMAALRVGEAMQKATGCAVKVKNAASPWERVAPLLTLDGRRPADLLSLIVDAKRRAKGEEADLWRQIDAEAVLLVGASIEAWNASPDHRAKRVRWKTDRLVAA